MPRSLGYSHRVLRSFANRGAENEAVDVSRCPTAFTSVQRWPVERSLPMPQVVIENPLNLIVEVTGAKDKDKEAKVSTAKTLWVPAVNSAGTWGRWAFVEVGDPWNAKKEILGQKD